MITNKIIPMFVFGTLMNANTLRMLDVAPEGKEDATLFGFRKSGLNIIEDKTSVVEGDYFLINESDLKILDRYESTDSKYGYHRFFVNVQVGDEMRRAYAYQVKGT